MRVQIVLSTPSLYNSQVRPMEKQQLGVGEVFGAY